MNKRDRFGLEYKPDLRQNKRELEKKQEKRRARLSGREVKEEPMTFPHKSKMSSDINDMSDTATDSESLFKQDMMVEQEEKQILPHKESVEIVSLGDRQEKKEMKTRACITAETKRDLIELLQEFKDVFVWSYQDMSGLSTNIVKKQFDAGFLQVVKYSEWVANIVPVPKKNGKVRICVDYRDLNKASPKDNFPLPHINILVDNKTEIKVYVDDIIAKSRIENEHEQILRRLFLRLRKFQLKLNPAKYTFEARSGKLLGFIVSEKGIKIDLDKVKAIQELPLPHTQKEKQNLGVRDEECQKTFDKVKHYLSNAPVLMPPSPDKPLILYLAVFENSMGCVIGQHNESGMKERAIYYLNKKFTESSRALEDYEPLNFDFPNEYLMYVATTEEDAQEGHHWKLNFDGASNTMGNRIGAALVSPSGDHYPFTSKLDFDCTNNMAKYEACIMGIRAAIERKIKVLEVYGDSALVIYQLKGEWETRYPKLIEYRRLVLELIIEFDDITFYYFPRDENQMADALATLASMVKMNKQENVKPIQMSIYEALAHSQHDKSTLKRLANDCVLDEEILYKRRRDQVLLRCEDAVEAKKILEEVHEGICKTHANGFTMARQIM
ncbi:reverse transcriptase [Gossypium australe]|uniref:Reverse transcriptase n=1 Tax=Gossypium australe TaxID=47621 RepID=A0A5B6UT81_9ROSI|nr:reverse transcriptase [Gossypium australe]